MINKQITDDNKQTILNVLKVTTLLIVTLIVLHCILNLYMCRTGNNNNNNITNNDNNKIDTNVTATIDTNVTATLKEYPSEPDVILTNTYVANVNGEIIKIPVVTPHELNSLDAKTTGKITQTIDLTHVVNNMNNKYKKNWEVGIGYGIHNGKSYVPVEIQRNYKEDKAISIEFHKTTKGTQGYEIKHKWKL